MPESNRNSVQQQIIDEFRTRGGKVGGYFAGMPLLLLTTIGARSGRQRTIALTYMVDGARYIVFAADGGAPRNPDWYYNLVAHPEVIVEVGVETFKATATVVTGVEHTDLFKRFTAEQPQLAVYQAKTTRQIPAIALTRLKDQAAFL